VGSTAALVMALPPSTSSRKLTAGVVGEGDASAENGSSCCVSSLGSATPPGSRMGGSSGERLAAPDTPRELFFFFGAISLRSIRGGGRRICEQAAEGHPMHPRERTPLGTACKSWFKSCAGFQSRVIGSSSTPPLVLRSICVILLDQMSMFSRSLVSIKRLGPVGLRSASRPALLAVPRASCTYLLLASPWKEGRSGERRCGRGTFIGALTSLLVTLGRCRSRARGGSLREPSQCGLSRRQSEKRWHWPGNRPLFFRFAHQSLVLAAFARAHALRYEL
jgi:hypothetical protein